MGLLSSRFSLLRESWESAMTGNLELLGHGLEAARDRGDFLDAVFEASLARAGHGCRHELEIVD